MMVAGTCANWCPRARAETKDLEPGYTDCCASHAEMNGVARADFTQLQNGTAYVTGVVCYTCAKLLAATGISLVVMIEHPSDQHRSPDRTYKLLQDCGIKYVVVQED
jgi:deoxycytidylate deaminase